MSSRTILNYVSFANVPACAETSAGRCDAMRDKGQVSRIAKAIKYAGLRKSGDLQITPRRGYSLSRTIQFNLSVKPKRPPNMPSEACLFTSSQTAARQTAPRCGPPAGTARRAGPTHPVPACRPAGARTAAACHSGRGQRAGPGFRGISTSVIASGRRLTVTMSSLCPQASLTARVKVVVSSTVKTGEGLPGSSSPAAGAQAYWLVYGHFCAHHIGSPKISNPACMFCRCLAAARLSPLVLSSMGG